MSLSNSLLLSFGPRHKGMSAKVYSVDVFAGNICSIRKNEAWYILRHASVNMECGFTMGLGARIELEN